MDLSQKRLLYKSVRMDKDNAVKMIGLHVNGYAEKKLNLKQVNKKGRGDFEVSVSGDMYLIRGRGNYTGEIKIK